jgi:hypothetical protein
VRVTCRKYRLRQFPSTVAVSWSSMPSKDLRASTRWSHVDQRNSLTFPPLLNAGEWPCLDRTGPPHIREGSPELLLERLFTAIGEISNQVNRVAKIKLVRAICGSPHDQARKPEWFVPNRDDHFGSDRVRSGCRELCHWMAVSRPTTKHIEAGFFWLCIRWWQPSLLCWRGYPGDFPWEI